MPNVTTCVTFAVECCKGKGIIIVLRIIRAGADLQFLRQTA